MEKVFSVREEELSVKLNRQDEKPEEEPRTRMVSDVLQESETIVRVYPVILMVDVSETCVPERNTMFPVELDERAVFALRMVRQGILEEHVDSLDDALEETYTVVALVL